MKNKILIVGLSACAIQAQAQIEVISGGNVGVGTSSPGNKFTVEGTGDVAAVGSSSRKFYFAPDTNGVGFFTGAGKTGNGLYADVTNNVLAVSTNSTERFRIDASGKMGLGTTAPAELLEVRGNNPAIKLVGTQSDYPSTVKIYSLGDNTNARSTVWLENNATAGGGGTIKIQGALSANSWNVTHIPTASGGVYNSLQLFTASAHALQLGTNNTAALTILSDGKVGLGTTTPTAKLQIGITDAGSVNEGIELDRLGVATTKFSMKLVSSAAGYYRGALEFTPNGGSVTEAITIGNEVTGVGGNVGIGTTTPGYKLEVAGTVRATNFISNTTTYADFVFDPGYKLSSLGEVEAHIKQLGHLPGIPSESEVKEQGIDLASMQVKLLQKIEELTLHQIAQEKQLSAQSSRIDRLETENTLLRNAARR